MYIHKPQDICACIFIFTHHTTCIYVHMYTHITMCAHTPCVICVYIHQWCVCIYSGVFCVCVCVYINPRGLLQTIQLRSVLSKTTLNFMFAQFLFLIWECLWKIHLSKRSKKLFFLISETKRSQMSSLLDAWRGLKALNPVEGAHSSDPPAEWPRSSTADPAGIV